MGSRRGAGCPGLGSGLEPCFPVVSIESLLFTGVVGARGIAKASKAGWNQTCRGRAVWGWLRWQHPEGKRCLPGDGDSPCSALPQRACSGVKP